VVAISKSLGFKPVGGMTSMDYFKEWWNNLTSALDVTRLHVERHHVTNYALGRVRSFPQGLLAGIAGFFRHIGLVMIQPCFRSDTWARSYGCAGCLAGFILSPLFIMNEICRAIVVFLDRLVTGCCNGCCGKSFLHTVDLRYDRKVPEKGFVKSQVKELAARGFSKQRQEQIFRASEHVVLAKRIFDSSSPFYPEHWHYKVAKASSVLSGFEFGREKLELSNEEWDVLRLLLQDRGDETLSFSMTLLLLRESVSKSSDQRKQFGASGRHIVSSDEYIDLWRTLFDTLEATEV